MTAYVISEIEVNDPETYKAYSAQVPAVVSEYGGRFLARGGKIDPLEGEDPKRVVVIEFPDMATARRWYDSPVYSKAKIIRQGASFGRLYIVEGID